MSSGRYHFGPKPENGPGPATVHAQIHEVAVGKTIKAVYLGDAEPITTARGKESSEYVVFEFTDGKTLGLEVAAGNSFFVVTDESARKLSPALR